jgi:GrpB-like predicted nucleotidyltransferase (UPF0157 family)
MKISRTIEVLDSDEAWSLEYQAEADRLRAVFGAALVAIHHIGSTAVPGLRAKPTIDIVVEVTSDVSIEAFYPGMRALGYDCRGECLDAIVPGTPGRHYFSKKVAMKHTHHVHVCHAGHHQVPELLALRDYLRAHPGAIADYGKLKTELAERFSHNNVEYMRGKDRFIKELIALAEDWRRPTKPRNAT